MVPEIRKKSGFIDFESQNIFGLNTIVDPLVRRSIWFVAIPEFSSLAFYVSSAAPFDRKTSVAISSTTMSGSVKTDRTVVNKIKTANISNCLAVFYSGHAGL